MATAEGRVTCEFCLKTIARAGAISAEVRDRYYCGADCRERYEGRKQDQHDLRRAIDDGMQDLRVKKA